MGNREKLLEAATAILGRNGYQATSVDEILESARVAPSNFYYHFKSKEELAIEVLEGYFEKSRQEMAPLFMNRSITATQKLERLHEAVVKKVSASGCCGGCPMGNLARNCRIRIRSSGPGFPAISRSVSAPLPRSSRKGSRRASSGPTSTPRPPRTCCSDRCRG